MVSAIGSLPTFSPAATTVASTAGIEAQIARDEKELSNCINCASAETKQGQADIQALTNKINLARARLEQITTANPDEQSIALNATTSSEADVSELAANPTGAEVPVARDNISEASTATPNESDKGVGRLVDEYV